jgi:hypothetical protein
VSADDHALLELVLNAFKDSHPGVLFSPLIPLSASLFLQRMDPALVLFVLDAMLQRGQFHFTLDERGFLASLRVIEEWICRKCRKFTAWLDSAGVSLTEVLLWVIPGFFGCGLSALAALTIFDAFVSEGRSVIFRLCAGFALTLEPKVSQEGLSQMMHDFFNRISDPTELESFLKRRRKRRCMDCLRFRYRLQRI